MVFDQTQTQSQEQKDSFKLASMNDRFLAFVFDVLIFSPIFSFFLAQVFKHLEILYYTAPGSFEFLALIGVSALMICILTVLFQTVFLLLFSATPGKLFMKLRVVSVHGGKLTFAQSLSRSTVWVAEFLMLAFPLLEIVSHPMRRPLHDRAADTVVRTLKQHGDSGPHFLEAQFVKQMLLGVFLLVITWGIFFTGHVYKMVLAGDFKKNELTEQKYLCQTVSDRVGSDGNRLDVASALYLADSLSAECLTAEADFALWSLSEDKKTWAYYAKMLISEKDAEKKTAYQGKICASNAELCDLANDNLNKITEKSELKNSHTYAVLSTLKNIGKSDVAAIKKDLESLEGFSGFRDFAQSVKIKLFWLEDKEDKAIGAFDTVALYMSEAQAQKISSWLCHQELDMGCESKAYSSCNVLKKQVSAVAEITDVSTAFALVRESQCKKTPLSYPQVEKIFTENKLAMKLLRAIDSRSEMPSDMRKAILLNMATTADAKENIYSEVAAYYAFTHELNRKDIETLQGFLAKAPEQSRAWQKMYTKTLNAAMKLNDKEHLKTLVSLVEFEKISTAKSDFKEQMALAFYQVEDYKKSWDLLKNDFSAPAGRTPASEKVGERVVQLIRKELSQKFEGK